MSLLGIIADHPTPKVTENGVCFTLNSRDYKGVVTIVISESDRQLDGKRISETWNARSDERNVCCEK